MFAPPKPYIGVTGFMTPEEIEALQALFGPDDSHQLMVGILVSHKTWNGIPSKYPNLFPPRARLEELVAAVDDTRAFTLFHYNAAGPAGDAYSSREEWVTDEAVFFEDCRQIIDEMVARWNPAVRTGVGGFQFNFPLPKRPSLTWLEARRRSLCGGPTRSVLQVWPQLLEPVRQMVCPEMAPAEFIDLEYGSHSQRFNNFPFQTVLYDASGGFGRELPSRGLLPALEPYMALCNTSAYLRLAIAGGLYDETIDTYRFVVESYAALEHALPGLSVDAQGKLRKPDGTMNLDAAKRYIERAQKLLSY